VLVFSARRGKRGPIFFDVFFFSLFNPVIPDRGGVNGNNFTLGV